MFYSTSYSSPVGMLKLAANDKGLAGLWIENQKYFGDTVTGEMVENADFALLKSTKDWLDRYFAGKNPAISEIPLAPTGGTFRQAVWKILCQIPYGEVITYGSIASQLAGQTNKPSMSAQAVGGAVGHNPISIIIPCHRVIGTNGSLTGYSGGIEKKIWLLTHEGANLTHLTIPKKGTAL